MVAFCFEEQGRPRLASCESCAVPWEATEVTSLPGNYAGLIGLMNDQA